MNSNKDKLFEGLRQGDLEDLVLPLISVDEYESKIDKDAIVIGFYVSDQDASIDLNRFIQKSSIEILDSEISPAPDQQGYFMVFVEMLTNSRTIENIIAISDMVASLINTERWDVQLRGHDDLIELTEENLKEHLDLKSNLSEQISNFFRESDIQDFSITKNKIVINGSEHELLEFGKLEEVFEKHSSEPIQFDFRTIARNSRLKIALGENWNVSSLKDKDIIWNSNKDQVLVIQNMDK